MPMVKHGTPKLPPRSKMRNHGSRKQSMTIHQFEKSLITLGMTENDQCFPSLSVVYKATVDIFQNGLSGTRDGFMVNLDRQCGSYLWVHAYLHPHLQEAHLCPRSKRQWRQQSSRIKRKWGYCCWWTYTTNFSLGKAETVWKECTKRKGSADWKIQNQPVCLSFTCSHFSDPLFSIRLAR
jgi:hypothetical protein